MSLPANGTFTNYPTLVETLPPLVRQQRKLERQIAPLSPLVEEEKACRKQIDALLLAAGLAKSEAVTCLGYDVTHCERDGSSRLNQVVVVEKLIAGGVDKDFALQVLKDSTESGEPAQWATVKPSKGASVRAPELPAKVITKNSRAMRRMREAS